MKSLSDPSPTLVKLGVVSAAVLRPVSGVCGWREGEGGRASGKRGVVEVGPMGGSSLSISHKCLST